MPPCGRVAIRCQMGRVYHIFAHAARRIHRPPPMHRHRLRCAPSSTDIGQEDPPRHSRADMPGGGFAWPLRGRTSAFLPEPLRVGGQLRRGASSGRRGVPDQYASNLRSIQEPGASLRTHSMPPAHGRRPCPRSSAPRPPRTMPSGSPCTRSFPIAAFRQSRPEPRTRAASAAASRWRRRPGAMRGADMRVRRRESLLGASSVEDLHLRLHLRK